MVEVNDGRIVMRSTFLEAYTYEEGVQLIAQQDATIKKKQQEIEQTEKFVEEKAWEKTLSEDNEVIEHAKNLQNIFNAALQDYYKEQSDKGRTFIHKEKAKRKYARLGDESKAACRSAIIADLADEIKIKDVAHPVLIELRQEFDKI